MIINSKGCQLSTLEDYLKFWTEKLQEKFGSDFYIKPESVISNFAVTSSLTNMMIESEVQYALKQLNPMTAEGEFQDALYSIIGLRRQYATFSVAQRVIQGTPDSVIEAGSVRIKNNLTDDIWELNSNVTIGTNGTAIGSFTAIELGAIDLPSNATLSVLDAPLTVENVYYQEGNDVILGFDYEDDASFRMRWQENQSLATSVTGGGIEKNLLDLVSNKKNLNVIQNRTNTTNSAGMPAHSLQIVIHSAYSDETIAEKIFKHLIDGVLLYGTTNVIVKDSAGTEEEIEFTRATVVPIYFKIVVKMKDNYILQKNLVKNVIVDNFDLAMGEKVVANNYVEFISDIEGIDYVDTIQISEDNSNWVNVDILEYNEIANVVAEHITVSEAE